ncbi:MAG: MATE family efflux transporter [Bacillota bacterium]|nr:MATE family efflux transporter [Bacillota bacterium]
MTGADNLKIFSDDPAREAFLNHPPGKLILRNSLPAVASMLFMACYHIADAVMVGRSLGPEALASVNILYPILAFFIGLAVMIGVGGNARVAVLQGAGKTIMARRVLGLVVTLGTILGVTGSVIVIFAYPVILDLLGTSGSLGVMAGEYLLTIYPFFTTMILIFVLEQTVRNDGRPNFATGVMMGMAGLNILLDYLFLFRLGMGIGGAALATGLSQTLGAFIFIAYFVYKALKQKAGLRFGIPGGGFITLKMVAFNGSSEFFTSVAAGVTTFLFNRTLLYYLGSDGVAAFAMVQYLMLIGSVVFLGLCTGSQPILSYNHGAGYHDRVKQTLVRLISISSLLGLVFFIILRTQSAAMIVLFIPEHPEAMKLTIEATAFISWTLLIMPISIISSMFFTALEKAGSSLLVAMSRGLVFTVIGLNIFPKYWAETGIWITPIFSEILTLLLVGILIYRWYTQPEISSVRQVVEPLPSIES